MKFLTNLFIYLLAKWLRFLRLSPSVQAEYLVNLIRLLIKKIQPKKTLHFLFELENNIYSLEGKASVDYGNGIHTKHRHTNYHNFFINYINPSDRVLDIGCGNGLLSYKMATKVPDVKVVGIERNEINIKFARKHYSHPNLYFILGDAIDKLPNEIFDVVTLSNVLEHIEDRINFLKKIIQQNKPKRLIIRVPLFERDWRVPLKKELGIDYRLDKTHFIEYTQEHYLKELRYAGLKTRVLEVRWGEIWSVVESISNRL